MSEGDSLVKTDVEGRKYKQQTGLETLVVYTVNYECCNLMTFHKSKVSNFLFPFTSLW